MFPPSGRRCTPLAREHPRLVHLAAALVGPPDPVWYRSEEMVVSLTQPEGEGWRAGRGRSTRGSARGCGVRHARLARRPARPERYLPEPPHGHGQASSFWVARMIMAGYHFMGEAPFAHVYFTSIVRDAQGPEDEQVARQTPRPARDDGMAWRGLRALHDGADADGQDLSSTRSASRRAKFFANKMWNATKLVPAPPGDENLNTVKSRTSS